MQDTSNVSRRQRWREKIEDRFAESAWGRVALSLLGVYLLIAAAIGWYWSAEPGNLPEPAASVPGEATTNGLIGVVETLLDKPGGLLSNDVAPPGVWLDNMPSWEYGALVQSRDLARAMRENFSRSQSQSQEDPDLARAEPRLNFDNKSWVLPASESEYREALKYLARYQRRLVNQDDVDAQFYARADNLRNWLSTVQTRLGSLSQRLSASVGQRRVNTDLAGDRTATQSTRAPSEMMVKTSWHQIDNVFYEARGSCWALIQFLRAVERDFEQVLVDKNAMVSLRQIIRELEATQGAVWSPVVLNGTGFGLLANHSLVMASYISRANAAMIDLRDLLSQG